MRVRSRRIALVASLLMIAALFAFASERIRWRAEVVAQKAFGEIQDIGWSELLPMMRPGSRPYVAEPVLKERVALATRMLVRARILDSSGHVSVRVPFSNRVLIGPGNLSRNLVTADDIVTVDLDSDTDQQSLLGDIGNRVWQTHGKRPPGETAIHTAIYRARPDVMSVIHTHPIHSLVFSVTMKPILPVTMHGGVFIEGVPVFPYVGHVNTRELGDELAKTLGDRHAVLIKMHGAAIAGNSLEQAFVAAVYLEENAEKQLWAEATGTVHPMTAEEAERAIQSGFDQQSIEKVWQYYADMEELLTR